MKKALLSTILGCIVIIAHAQTGTIKGKITTSDGKPAAYVTVRIDRTEWGAMSNDRGEYVLRRVQPGNWIVEISAVGLATQQKAIGLAAGENIEVNFVINETATELHEVTVNAQRNKAAEKESEYVARMPLKNLENPQSYSIATKELLQEKNITDYQSAVSSIPGIALSTVDYQGSSTAFVRGFSTNPYIRNGIYFLNLVSGDPQNIERLEAIKGPAGTLYGSQGVSYGGLINRVTKKPFGHRAGELGLSLGSFGFTRLTADVNTPLKTDSSVLLRVNAAATWQQSFQDNGYQKSYLFAPSLYYRINDRLDVLVDVELNSIRHPALTAYPVYSATGYARYDEVPLDYFKTYGTNKADYPPSTTHNFYTQLNYKLSDNWRISGNIAYGDFNYNSGTIGLTLYGQDSLLRDLYDFDWQYNSVDIQPNLNGEFYIGKVRNRLLVGLDYQNIKTVATGYYLGPQDTINFRQFYLSFPVKRIRASQAYSDSYYEEDFKQKAYAAYASDVIGFGERLNILLSLRYDHYQDGGYQDRNLPPLPTGPDAGTVAPKLGATYQLVRDRLTLFANYMQGIHYVAPDVAGHVFDPERARQTEGGIKIELAGGKLSSTISYYDIRVKDKVRTDPSNPNLSIQDGTQESKGVDVDVMASPVEGLSIIAGYEYNSNKYLKSDAGLEGKRPYGTPPHSGNAWVSYTLRHGAAKGLGIGAGAVYSDNYFGTDDDAIVMPGYVVFSGSLFYDLPKFRVSLGMDNITDKHYWDVFGTPQMTRRITGSLLFRF